MNHCVPSFDIDEDYPTPSVSRPRKATLEGDGIMELLWQNGTVVVQSQKLGRKSAASDFNGDDLNNSGRREIHHQSQPQQNLFMQEDEMASWLHYPLNDAAFDNDFCSDLLYSPAPCVNATTTEAAAEAPAATTTTTTTASTATPTASAHRAAQLAEQSKAKMSLRPPIPPSRIVAESFGNWTSRSKARVAESVPSGSNLAANDFTVVDSNQTPTAPPQSRVSEPAHLEMAARGTIARTASLAASSSGTGTDAAACEMMLRPSSPGTSSASPELRPLPLAPPEDRKRKGRELDDADCYSEDIELESPDAKKHARGSTSAKRSRAAEVHNLSERRRRDRINEKMRALQELVPNCNKADKASMLDEAIEYLKSLQMQVQMMSMGCSMVPMMFPGVQQYMPPNPQMAAAMGMAAMGGMGMNRPMMPFSNIMPGGSLSTAGAAHMGPRFPMPTPFHHMQQQQQQQQHFGGAEPSRIIPPNTHSANPMMGSSSFVMQNPNHPPNFVDPYQQYLSLHHMQFQPQQQQQLQNQAVDHRSNSKSGTSKGAERLERHPSGSHRS